MRIIDQVYNELIKHAEINFDSILSITYVKEMQNLQIHTQLTHISDSFGVVKFCSLRGEGRVEGGVRMKHMITLE